MVQGRGWKPMENNNDRTKWICIQNNYCKQCMTVSKRILAIHSLTLQMSVVEAKQNISYCVQFCSLFPTIFNILRKSKMF